MHKSFYFLVAGAALASVTVLLNRAAKQDKHLRRIKNKKSSIQEWENEGGTPAVGYGNEHKSN